jgi:hypothetical protein
MSPQRRSVRSEIDGQLRAPGVSAVHERRSVRSEIDGQLRAPGVSAVHERRSVRSEIDGQLRAPGVSAVRVCSEVINRLTAAAPNLRPGIQQHIDWLDQEIRALEQELDNEAERTDEVRRKRELRDSVPGIGAITALNLLLRLPELGTINRKEAAAVVALRRMPIRAAHSANPGISPAAGGMCAACCTWRPWRPRGAVWSGAPSISACVKLASRARSPSSLRCASC